MEESNILIEKSILLETEVKFDSALMILNELIEKYHHCPGIKSSAYLRIATILCKSHQVESGISYYNKSLALANQLHNDTLIGKAYLGLGITRHIKNQLDSAIHFYTKAVPYLNEANQKTDLIGAYNNIGLSFSSDGKLDSAAKYYSKSIELSLASGDTLHATLGYFNISKDYYNENNLQMAIRFLDKAEFIFTQSNLNSDVIFKTYRLKSQILQRQGFYEEATYFFEKYDSSAQKYLTEDNNDKILDLETKYRTAEIERDNAIKQAQIEVQDQRMIYLYVIAALLLLGIIGVYLYNEQRKKVIRALALQKDQENEKRINDLLNDQELKSAYAMLAGQEKAHKRIAEELHDNLGSILVTLNMFADSLQNKKDPKAQKELAGRIGEIAHQANETTRQISHSLHSGVLKHFGLEIAIKELIDALNESDSVTVESHVQITSKLDSDLSMNVYRIVQELVNNTLKHSKASKITLELNQIKDHLSLIYSDNGMGFNQEQVVNGLGLKNLESRVDRLDGTITIESKPGQGTTTIIEVPVS